MFCVCFKPIVQRWFEKMQSAANINTLSFANSHHLVFQLILRRPLLPLRNVLARISIMVPSLPTVLGTRRVPVPLIVSVTSPPRHVPTLNQTGTHTGAYSKHQPTYFFIKALVFFSYHLLASICTGFSGQTAQTLQKHVVVDGLTEWISNAYRYDVAWSASTNRVCIEVGWHFEFLTRI